MSSNVETACYPEVAFTGFTRVDASIAFYVGIQAMAEEAETVLDVGCDRGAFLFTTKTSVRSLLR